MKQFSLKKLYAEMNEGQPEITVPADAVSIKSIRAYVSRWNGTHSGIKAYSVKTGERVFVISLREMVNDLPLFAKASRKPLISQAEYLSVRDEFNAALKALKEKISDL